MYTIALSENTITILLTPTKQVYCNYQQFYIDHISSGLKGKVVFHER